MGLADHGQEFLQRIVPPVLNSFTDQDSRVRYYACEVCGCPHLPRCALVWADNARPPSLHSCTQAWVDPCSAACSWRSCFGDLQGQRAWQR